MSHNHKKKLMKMVEQQLGLDYDTNIIEEVARHMEDCPNCKIYIDSVRQTISLYRTTEQCDAIPEAVSERLFKVLNLKTGAEKPAERPA